MIQLLKQIIAVCMGLGFAFAANSQPFPQKLIKIVVPFTPGAGRRYAGTIDFPEPG